MKRDSERHPHTLLSTTFSACLPWLIGCFFLGSSYAQTQLPASGYINTIAGSGTAGYSGDGGPATSAKLNAPRGVTFDASGNIYIADYSNNRIRAVNTGSTTVLIAGVSIPAGDIATVAGTGTAGYSGDNGPATSAKLFQPEGVALDSAGNIYIADTYNQRIRVVNTGSTSITIAGVSIPAGDIATVAGTGTAGYLGDGGGATSAELNYPESIAVDRVGNIYVGDYSNQRIRAVNTGTSTLIIAGVSIQGGDIATIAGTGTAGYYGDLGLATNAELNYPQGVAVDTAGNIYIADKSNNRIRKLTAATGIITTVAGNGTAGYSGDNGPAASAELDHPYGVAVDRDSNLYIADQSNNRIRTVNNAANTLTIAGVSIQGGDIATVAGDGTACSSPTNACGDSGLATNANLNLPFGAAVDNNGYLYIADQDDNRIRAVGSSNVCTVYVSPNGNGTGNGATYANSVSLASMTTAQMAGPVICLEGGTYNLGATLGVTSSFPSGSATLPITWRAYGDSMVNFVWTGGTSGTHHQMLSLSGTWPNGPSYIDFVGRNMWTWNGDSYASTAFIFYGGHNLGVSGMYIKNTVGSGLGAVMTDYINWNHNVTYEIGEDPNGITADVTAWSINGSNVATFTARNTFSAGESVTLENFSNGTFFNGQAVTVLSTGLSSTQFEADFTHTAASGSETVAVAYLYLTGWSSAYSINSPQNYNNSDTGIHNYIYDNIAVGTYDSSYHHTDGNGIILDLDPNTWPATLIMNNIVYGNGGRCIETDAVGQQFALIFNDTCYENGLDTSNSFPEIYISSNYAYAANNIAYGSGADGCTPEGTAPLCEWDYYENGSPTNTVVSDNLYYGGFGNSGAIFSSVTHANPSFANAPTLLAGDYGAVADPGIAGANLGTTLGNIFYPGYTSIGMGVDPTTLSGLNSSIVNDLKPVLVYQDFYGTVRPISSGSWDFGAIQTGQ